MEYSLNIGCTPFFYPNQPTMARQVFVTFGGFAPICYTDSDFG